MLCISALSLSLFAQSDSVRTVQLGEVQVQAVAHRLYAVGQAQYRTDSVWHTATRSMRLADVLRFDGLANIRSYGAAMTSTIGLRGGTANQTAVIWNGFRLPTPLSGLTDASLLPAAFFDEVRVIPGGQGALWGSSAVGGVLALQSQHSATGLRAELVSGSFGQWAGNIDAHLVKGRWQSSTRLSLRKGHFGYWYTIPNTDIRRKLDHAASQWADVMQQVSYQAGKHWRLEYAAWLNTAQREVPPNMAQNISLAVQRDLGNRHTVQAHYQKHRLRADMRVGRFDEQIRFDDSLTRVFSVVRFVTYSAEAEGRYELKANHILHGGVQHAYTIGSAPGYSHVRQSRVSVFSSYRANFGRLTAQTDLRFAFRFIPAVAFGYQVNRWLHARARFGATYRQPSFNELYWQPGGNPNLKDESGWSAETGTDMNLQRGNFSLSWSQTVYQRKTRNQILWSPRFGTSIWSPDNLGLVRTTGLDTRLTLSQKLFRQQTAQIKLGYDLADARNLIAISVPAIGEGTQLWFVPRHQAWCRLQYMGNNWSVFGAAHLHGRVSTPEGGLAPVHLLSAGFSKMFKIKKLPLTVSGRLENLANQTWFSIDRRPLPGRNWQLGFSYHIQ